MAASTSSVAPAHRVRALPIAAGCCAMGAAAYVAARDPSSGGIYPVCAFRSVTGWWCPGCGITRATHHLLHGDLAQALAHNALVIPVGVALVIAWIAWLVDGDGRRPTWMHRAAVPAWLGLAAVAVVFTILRNVPAFDVLRR